MLGNTKLDSAVDGIRGLGAWYWNGHKSELDTGETRGFESRLLEEIGGPRQVLEGLAWGEVPVRS